MWLRAGCWFRPCEVGLPVIQHASICDLFGVYSSPIGNFFVSAHEVVVPAHGKAIVKTDLAVATPLDCYARIGEY